MEPITANDKGSFTRHLRAIALVRTRRIVRTIPATTSLPQARQWQHYAVVAVNAFGRRNLERVIWPWQARPQDPKANPAARVMRGRLSNPTALR